MAIRSISYSGEFAENKCDVELTKLELKQDTNGYYLSATFKVDDIRSVREVDVPKIRLPINARKVAINATDDSYWGGSSRANIDLGFAILPLECGMTNGYNAMYTEKILEEKYTEMTMDEIEKKLGYKVKIVNK